MIILEEPLRPKHSLLLCTVAPSDAQAGTQAAHEQELNLHYVFKVWSYGGGGCYCDTEKSILTEVATKLPASTSRIPLQLLVALLVLDNT